MFISYSIYAPTASTVWKTDGDAMTWRAADGVSYRRVITMTDYVITVTDTVKNGGRNDVHIMKK